METTIAAILLVLVSFVFLAIAVDAGRRAK
jgi:hypothetical protein